MSWIWAHLKTFFLKKYNGNIIMGITISIPGVIFKLVPFKLSVSFQRNFSSLSAPFLIFFNAFSSREDDNPRRVN